MPYTDEQIGPRELKPITAKTKERLAVVVVQHGREPGVDETHVTVAAPISWQAGRRKALGLVSRGIDIDDVRFVLAEPDSNPERAGDGQPMQPISKALWWTVDDDRRLAASGLSIQEFAAAELERIGRGSGPDYLVASE